MAGLAVTLSLRKRGIDAICYEKYPELSDNGLGFLILGNGIAAFEELGVLDRIKAEGNEAKRFIAKDFKGKEIKSNEIDNTLIANRGKCMRALLDELPEDAVEFNKGFIGFGYDIEGNADCVLFEDGTFVFADIIIASDGVNSNIRSMLYPEAEMIDIDEKEMVGTVYLPELCKELGNTFLKIQDQDGKRAMGVLPCGDGQVIWFAQFDSTIYGIPLSNTLAKRDFMHELVEGWPEPLQKVLTHTDFETTYVWRLRKMDLLPTFHKKGVLLIGDAAHPLLPFTSQGANSALTDAIRAADIIADHKSDDDFIKAFELFDLERRSVISQYIIDGENLLDRFLNPEKYENYELPFIQDVVK